MDKQIGFSLMILLAGLPIDKAPSWHNWFLPVVGTFITILITIIGVLIIRWMNKSESIRSEDMKRLDNQRKEDLTSLENIRQRDHEDMREAINGLTTVMTELTNETKKKAVADARFEEKIFHEVKDFHEKMGILTINVQNHEKAISDINNEIKNIKKRHKVNHGEDL